jgi:hypothetical protein
MQPPGSAVGSEADMHGKIAGVRIGVKRPHWICGMSAIDPKADIGRFQVRNRGRCVLAVSNARHGCNRPVAGACARKCSSYVPRPVLAHCSSWSPVAPLTPTAPVTLPSIMIGNPPGEAKTPGRVAEATPPLLITSVKTRVGRQ